MQLYFCQLSLLCTHVLEDYYGYFIQTSITKSSNVTVCAGIDDSPDCESICRHVKLRGMALSVNLGFYNPGVRNVVGDRWRL